MEKNNDFALDAMKDDVLNASELENVEGGIASLSLSNSLAEESKNEYACNDSCNIKCPPPPPPSNPNSIYVCG
jgi:hypothetical protein